MTFSVKLVLLQNPCATMSDKHQSWEAAKQDAWPLCCCEDGNLARSGTIPAFIGPPASSTGNPFLWVPLDSRVREERERAEF